MPETSVREHLRITARGRPYPVRRHRRHVYVLPKQRMTRSFDEVSEEDFLDAYGDQAPTIRRVDPQLVALTGHTASDRRTIADYLRDPSNADSTRAVRERLRRGLEVDPISIVIDRDSGDELEFNGAHRAIAAISSGVREIPVEVYMSDGGPFSDTAFRKWVRSQMKLRSYLREQGEARLSPIVSHPG